jgi:hypothetical protein
LPSKHVINLIMWIRDMGCHSPALGFKPEQAPPDVDDLIDWPGSIELFHKPTEDDLALALSQ